MNKKTRETLRNELKTGVASEKLVEKNKGKNFLTKLDACNNTSDVAGLICQIMPNNIFEDRLQHVSDNPLIIPFHTASLRVNIDRGYEPRHVDYVTLAVGRCIDITGNKDVKEIKSELKKNVQQKVMIKMSLNEKTAVC